MYVGATEANKVRVALGDAVDWDRRSQAWRLKWEAETEVELRVVVVVWIGVTGDETNDGEGEGEDVCNGFVVEWKTGRQGAESRDPGPAAG